VVGQGKKLTSYFQKQVQPHSAGIEEAWHCPRCTFINNMHPGISSTPCCEMCGTESSTWTAANQPDMRAQLAKSAVAVAGEPGAGVTGLSILAFF
jgi:hypothetical protein